MGGNWSFSRAVEAIRAMQAQGCEQAGEGPESPTLSSVLADVLDAMLQLSEPAAGGAEGADEGAARAAPARPPVVIGAHSRFLRELQGRLRTRARDLRSWSRCCLCTAGCRCSSETPSAFGNYSHRRPWPLGTMRALLTRTSKSIVRQVKRYRGSVRPCSAFPARESGAESLSQPDITTRDKEIMINVVTSSRSDQRAACNQILQPHPQHRRAQRRHSRDRGVKNCAKSVCHLRCAYMYSFFLYAYPGPY